MPNPQFRPGSRSRLIQTHRCISNHLVIETSNGSNNRSQSIGLERNKELATQTAKLPTTRIFNPLDCQLLKLPIPLNVTLTSQHISTILTCDMVCRSHLSTYTHATHIRHSVLSTPTSIAQARAQPSIPTHDLTAMGERSRRSIHGCMVNCGHGRPRLEAESKDEAW